MDETTLRELLGSALAGEPPIGPVAQNALRAGIRRRRRRVLGAAGGVAVVAAVAVVAVVATAFSQHSASPERLTGGHAARQSAAARQLSAAPAARAHAVSWIMHEVTHAAVVGCDPHVCAELTSQGFPSGNLVTLGPQSNDPIAAGLVVVTPAIQAQFGNRLASVYAPAIIASFGSGKARIDIRLVTPGGAKGYRATQRADLRARRTADALLLTNSRIEFSATARRQLGSGDIDPRLPMLIATMVQSHPVRIVSFGGSSPGGGPASLLRWVDVARVNRGTHLTRAAYLSWMQSLIHAQRAEYRPARSQQVPSSTGQTVVRIEYLAPSPLSPDVIGLSG
jgi:hypothetical protein